MKLSQQLVFNLGILTLASLTACSSLSSHKQKTAEIMGIQTGAVVSLAVEEPASSELSFDLGSKTSSIESGGGSLVGRTSPHVTEIHKDLSQTLAKNLKWKMLSAEQLSSHEGYKKAYNKTMKGWQNKMATPQGRNLFLAANIMDADGMRILGAKGRDELCDSLGVDALVVAKVNVNFNGTTVMGIGQRRPQAALMFQVYKKGRENPVWFEGQILGQEAKKSVGATGFTDQSLLHQLSRESAQSAFEKIKLDSVTAAK